MVSSFPFTLDYVKSFAPTLRKSKGNIQLDIYDKLVLPLKKEPLDVQTMEPFFSDEMFISKWRPEKVFFEYKSKEDFVSVCNIIDKYPTGLKIQTFSLII